MNIDYGAEQAPRARLSVHVQHSQYLQESYASNCRCGKHLAIRADHDNKSRSHNNQNVNETNGLAGKLESTLPAHVFATTAGGPQPHTVFDAEK